MDDQLPHEDIELMLKKQELKLKEAKTRVKERELSASKWFNPVVIGLFAAALGLAGNVFLAFINNKNTQTLERSRTQSDIVLESIKTNGDTQAACKNLVFFVSLNLIEDTNHVITAACPDVQGVPSLSVGPPDKLGDSFFYPLIVQALDGTGKPIPDVNVEAKLITPVQISSDFLSWIESDKNYKWIVERTNSHCKTDKSGNCFLGMAPSGKFIVLIASKYGYSGNRDNIFFTGTSVPLVLNKVH